MLECGLRAVVLHNKEVVWNYYAEFTADCRRINTKRISIPNNYTVTLKSTRQYDTIIIVGQVGGKVIFDVIPLHPTNSCAVHLGEINSIITNATASTVEIKIDSYAVCMAVGYGNLSIS